MLLTVCTYSPVQTGKNTVVLPQRPTTAQFGLHINAQVIMIYTC